MDGCCDKPLLIAPIFPSFPYPTHTSSILRPCDQGFINSFKCHYRWITLEKLLNILDESDELSWWRSQLFLTLAASFVQLGTVVRANAIINCWKMGGLSSMTTEDEEIEYNIVH
jgi:hypothetical protein